MASPLNDPEATPATVACGSLPVPEQGKARLNSHGATVAVLKHAAA